MEQANKLTAGDYEGIKSVQRLHTQLNTHENAHETWFICFSKRASANACLAEHIDATIVDHGFVWFYKAR